MVVVEVDEDVLARGPAAREPGGPRRERRVAVCRPRPRSTLVEAEVRPVRGPPDRAQDAASIRQAEGGAMIHEEPADLVREPARMAELDGDPDLGREAIEGP